MIRVVFLVVAIFAFLNACSTRDNRSVTKSGFPYIHHIASEGPKPQPGEYVTFDVIMRFQDSILNSSLEMDQKPSVQIPKEADTDYSSSAIIDGLRLMSIGDSLTLFFDLDSLPVKPAAYQHFDVITYDLKLLQIKTEEEFRTEMDEMIRQKELVREKIKSREPEVRDLVLENLAEHKQESLETTKTASGLELVVLELGDGPRPKQGDLVSVHYYGVLRDGEVFDSSFREGDPYQFRLGTGRVIKGWDEGISYLASGSKVVLFIPYQLAYGEGGYLNIPERADLVFYVELESINTF
jgi:FKBP-type peptidyl-prolyl cis-trans isomerase FkpA